MSTAQNHQSTPVHEWNPLTEILITTTQMAENDATQIHYMEYMVRARVGKYGIGGEVAIKMPWAERSQASIPSPGTRFRATEGQCALYYHILRSNNLADMHALEKWQDLDAVLASDDVKRTLFGDSCVKNHIYTPCVRKILNGPDARDGNYVLKVQMMKGVHVVNQYPNSESSESDADECKSHQGVDRDDDGGRESTTIHKFSKSNPQILTQFLVRDGTVGDEYRCESVDTMSDVREVFRSHGYFQDTLHIAHVWKTRTIDWYGRYLYGVTLRVVKVCMRDSIPEMCMMSSVPKKSGAMVDEGAIVTDSDGFDNGVHAYSAERPAGSNAGLMAEPVEPDTRHGESSIPDQAISQEQCLAPESI
jgi:hypothetical protein